MAGAPTNPQSDHTRVGVLERRVAILEAELSRRRRAAAVWPKPVHLAETTTSSVYPAPPGDTFQFFFSNGTFTESDGDQTAVLTARQNTPQRLAHAIDGRYYPDDADVLVAAIDRKYWIIGGQAISKVIDFTLTSAIVSAAASALASVDAYYDGADPGSLGQTVYNTHSAIYYAPIGASGQAIWDDFRGRYQIVQTSGGAPATGTALWGRSQANWATNAGDPRVSIKQVTGSPGRTSSTVSGSAFWCYLPPTHDGDPNIVSGQNVAYVFDQDGNAVCGGEYLDAKIGTVRMWAGDKADIPTGWGLMDGVANAGGNGGTGYAMVSGSDQYFALATDVDSGGGNGAVGTDRAKDGTQGQSTIVITAHMEADFEAILVDHDAATIDDHAAGVTGSGTASIGNHTGDTGFAYTGLNNTNVLADAHGFSCHNVKEAEYPDTPVECVDCEIDTHIMTVNDPQHRHSLGTLTHTDSGHTHSTPELAHSGTLAHDVVGNLAHSVTTLPRPEFINLMFIERLDNSI